MSFSAQMSRDKFPFVDLPNTLQQYYEHANFVKWQETPDLLGSVVRVRAALKTDENFKDFWKKYCEENPETEDYSSISTKLSDPVSVFKMKIEYGRFLKERTVSDISDSTKEKFQSEFDAIRPALYQSFLEKEAARLNCSVFEVRPIATILPLKDSEGESKLCSLPDDLFVKIMARLETIEVFRMTQTCKKWRDIVYKNASTITSAEHCVTTHLLTFASWLDPSNDVERKDYKCRYRSFGWGLVKWCTNIAQNLERLVVTEFKASYIEFIDLLRKCPNLQHLHIKFNLPDWNRETDFCLPKLKSLIVEESLHLSTSNFVIPVLATSHQLQLYVGKLNVGDRLGIYKKSPYNNAFSSLIALELASIRNGLLSELVALDQLQLRYLYLGEGLVHCEWPVEPYVVSRDMERIELLQLLLKLPQLEVLVSLWNSVLDERTIKLITKHHRNLKSALLLFNVTSVENEEVFWSIVQSAESSESSDDYDEHAALISFEEMLLEKDPTRDLSSFAFVVEDARSKAFLEKAGTSFSIYEKENQSSDLFRKWSLSHPAMRKLLGIECLT